MTYRCCMSTCPFLKRNAVTMTSPLNGSASPIFGGNAWSIVMKAGVLGEGVVIVPPAPLLEYGDCRVGENIVFARCTECRTYYYEHSACSRIGSAVGLGHGNDTRSPIPPMHVEKRQW